MTVKLPMKLCRSLCAALLSVAVLAGANPARADLTAIPDAVRAKVSPPQIEAKSWILVDPNSGWILGGREPELRIEPASLTKIMSAYLVFKELAKGSMQLDTPVHVSEHAWRTGGSRTFLPVNSIQTVDTLLKGLIVQSGNDATVALAEHIAGSEAGFVELMNRAAAELGMTGTHFENSTGLPSPEHYSTALDIARVTSALIREYPEYYKYYSIKEFTFNNITQKNRNVLLTRDPTVDGVKTGHTKSAGYCLVASAKRDGMRLIAIVIDAKSPRNRANAAYALLKYGFAAYETPTLYRPGDVAVEVPLFKSSNNKLPVGTLQAVAATIPRGTTSKLSADLFVPQTETAPIQQGARVGSVKLSFDGTQIADYPLVALREEPLGGWFDRLYDSVRIWFY